MNTPVRVPLPYANPDRINEKTPVTIFTGFLGSGKTTVIANLVDQLQASGQKISYIKNELGDIDLDAKLLGGKFVVARELLNGCVCCTLSGPLIEALEEIITSFTPDRIILESSGTAEPANLAVTITGSNKVFRDGIVTVIDCVNFEGFEQINEYTKMTTKLTDLIVLNKVELVDERRKQTVINRVKDLNDYSPMIEAVGGSVEPTLVFGLHTKELETLLSNFDQPVSDNKSDISEHDEQKAHQTHESTQIINYRTHKVVVRDKFEAVLNKLPEQVLRVKGLVNLKDEGWRVINGVFRRIDYFTPPPDLKMAETGLILIGININAYKDQIAALLDECVVSE